MDVLQIYLVFASGFILSPATTVLCYFMEHKTSNSQGVAQAPTQGNTAESFLLLQILSLFILGNFIQ